MRHSGLMERTERVDLGLEIADAGFIELSYSFRVRSLTVVYLSGVGPERLVEVLFADTAAFRLQEAEFSIGQDDPCDDFTYEVIESTWLATHVMQNYVEPEAHLRHFKFSFAGSSPTLEVLCGSVTHTTRDRLAAPPRVPLPDDR